MPEDIKKEDTWTLTYKDYIDYELKHELISLNIKSLLMTKSFLFVGYNLSDIDFQQILNWINIKKKEVDSTEAQFFFLNAEENKDILDETILESLGINIIQLNNVYYKNHPVIEKIINNEELKKRLPDEKGRLLYSFLHILNNPRYLRKISAPINEIKKEIKTLRNYSFINMQDLRNIVGYGYSEYFNGTLTFFNKSDYDFVEILVMYNEDIKEAFLRSRIREIKLKDTDTYFKLEGDISFLEKQEETLFNLNLNNDFNQIRKLLKEDKDLDINTFKYYSFLTGIDVNEAEVVDNRVFYNQYENSSLLTLTLNAIRNNLNQLEKQFLFSIPKISSRRELSIPQLIERLNSTDKKAVSFFFDLYNGRPVILKEFENRLNQIKDFYKEERSFIKEQSDPLYELLEQGRLFYYFFKYNNFALENKVITYSIFSKVIESLFISQNATLSDYTLDEIDFDILTKFSLPSDLIRLKRKYQLEKIRTKNIDIVENLKNLILSIKEIGNETRWNRILQNYLILFPFFDLEPSTVFDLYEFLIEFLEENNDYNQGNCKVLNN